MRGLVRHLLGWTFLLVGVAGLVLPVVQGWLFLALGAVLLARDVPLFARMVCWLEGRFPGLKSHIRSIRATLGGRHGPPPCGEPPAQDAQDGET